MLARFFSAFLSLILFFSFLPNAISSEKKTAVGQEIKQPNQDQPILIQASRLESAKVPLRSVSSNTSVISKTELKSSKPRTFQEAVKNEAGVVLYDDAGNGLDTTVSLRGFNQSSAVTVLVDGVRVNELDGNTVTFPLISMDDIERIQIDRGSSAPVYGSNALAGVVNVTTGRPSKKPWRLFGGFDVNASQHHAINFFQGLNGTIQDHLTGLGGAFEYYFKGGRNIGDGYRGNSEFRITSFDVKTAYVLPEESGRFYINVKHARDMISNPGELTFAQYQASTKTTNKPIDRREYKNTIVQVGADKKFWDDKITASLMTDVRLNHLDFMNTTTQFGTSTTLVGSKSRAREITGQISYQDAWEWIKSTSLIGFEARKTFELATRISAPGGEVSPTAATTLDRDGHFLNSAIFWNERMGLTDYVDVNVGMRHDRYSLRTINPKGPSSNYTDRWKSSTVSTGVTFHPVKASDVFFQFSQGFRVPSLSDVNSFGGSTPPDVLNPERSNQYEVGTRYRFRDLFKIKSSLFLIDMQDEIVNDSKISLANPFGQNVNIWKSRRQGIENEIEIHPMREVSMFGTYTWTQAYVRETNRGDDGLGVSQIFDGRDLGQVPRQRLTWGTEINPLTRLGEPFAGLKFRIDGTYTGQQHPQSFENTSQATLDATGGPGHVIKSFALWNFLTSYTFKNQEIYFKVNNLFDNKYYSRAVVSEIFTTGTYPAGSYAFVNPGAPREYLLGMRWEIE